jgi:2-polyprenyl-3-methyl-5-hydroxy-6-metoxy-1,4-benzoquinol methylase
LLEDQGFDAVVSIEGIEHLESPARFLRGGPRRLRRKSSFVWPTMNGEHPLDGRTQEHEGGTPRHGHLSLTSERL